MVYLNECEKVSLLIREITVADAAELAALFIQLDAETAFMAMGEQINAAELENYLCVFNRSSAQAFYVLEYENKLVGFAIAIAAYVTSNPNTLSVVIGLKQAYAGLGFGTQLLTQLETWARANNFSGLELLVMAHNRRAIRFYQRAGFERKALKQDPAINEAGENELYMVKSVI